MTICSSCKKEVNDIRPQIEGVGICFACGSQGKKIPKEALEKWKEIDRKKKNDK